ncbi:hypothetical protein [Kocuria massiliensis]|uniref:hypothetical protein n=1 Tax=Kocuria massiliensis TaxID=1926282 RepID=UPI000A1CA202|nr:hypothetical protein [Kocuria massiliensis]
MSGSNQSARHHSPVKFSPAMFEQLDGGVDPEVISQAAHTSAWALLSQGRANNDPGVTERLVDFTDHYGLDAIAEMWAEAPGVSLPGVLWRIYALRDTVRRNPDLISRYYHLGQDNAQVSRVVAGVAEPPEADELCRTIDQILTGAYTGEFDVALERFAAFCRVVALGQAVAADRADDDAQFEGDEGRRRAGEFTTTPGSTWAGMKLTRAARKLITTAEELESAASAWRHHQLD